MITWWTRKSGPTDDVVSRNSCVKYERPDLVDLNQWEGFLRFILKSGHTVHAGLPDLKVWWIGTSVGWVHDGQIILLQNYDSYFLFFFFLLLLYV